MHPMVVFLSGFSLCSLLLFLFLRTRLVRLFGDSPDHRKVHWVVVPRSGGLAMVATFLTFLAFALLNPGNENFGMIRKMIPTLFFTGGFLLLAGTLDDIRPVNFKIKFALQFALAGILVLIFHNGFEAFYVLGVRLNLEGAGPFISKRRTGSIPSSGTICGVPSTFRNRPTTVRRARSSTWTISPSGRPRSEEARSFTRTRSPPMASLRDRPWT